MYLCQRFSLVLSYIGESLYYTSYSQNTILQRSDLFFLFFFPLVAQINNAYRKSGITLCDVLPRKSGNFERS
jgi:hypothetical protein